MFKYLSSSLNQWLLATWTLGTLLLDLFIIRINGQTFIMKVPVYEVFQASFMEDMLAVCDLYIYVDSKLDGAYWALPI